MKRTNARRGFNLVELVVVISISSIIFSAVAVMLHGMYRADRVARRELESSVNLDRLAARFRTDAHGANSAEAKEAALVFKFRPEKEVEYKFAESRVERTVRQGDKVEHHDSFRLTSDAVVTWHIEGEGAPAFVSLQVARSEGKPSRIDARVSADHRWEK